MTPARFGEACAAIARAITESLPLERVLELIGAAARLVVPVDALGMWHAESPDDPLRLTLGPGQPRNRPSGEGPLRRTDHSSRLWPAAGASSVCIIADAPRELDASFAGDRVLIEMGYRSALVLGLGDGNREVLWLVHHAAGVYTPEQARTLQPLVDLTTLAAEHAQLHALTRRE